MDCEKVESAMLDELYGELDELTSAALKRHIAGCARCAALLSGLRATRRLAALPLVEPPAALEERILRVASETRPVLPLDRRFAHMVSLAGNWAMRPQTAMAAVFLVMFGTSVLLLRGKSSRAPASASITVTEEGTPAPVACVAGLPPPEPVAASPTTASSQLTPTPRPTEAKPVVAAATGSPADSPLGALRPRTAAAKAATAADEERAVDSPTASAAPAGMAYGAPAPAVAPGAGAAGAAAAAVHADSPQRAFATAPAAPDAQASFATALSAYRAGRFEDAFRAFDALSTSDPIADLYAARSLRQGRGCRASLERFDRVAVRAPGSTPAWDALLEGAYCYASVGNVGQARNNLNRLRSVDSHRDRAQKELDRLAGVRVPAASPPAASPPADQPN
jgi:hypothetical protein